jgi:hypothetical protein
VGVCPARGEAVAVGAWSPLALVIPLASTDSGQYAIAVYTARHLTAADDSRPDRED